MKLPVSRSLVLVLTAVVGCSSASGRDGGGKDLGAGGGGGGGGGGGVEADMAVPTHFSDFPPTPVIDPTGGTTPNAPGLFGSPDSGNPTGGPCLLDPQMGALFPQNWLRPRFTFVAPGGQNLFEIRLHADKEVNDLVIYTAATTWTMDAKTWSALTAHLADQPITVTIRGAVFDGTKLTSGPSLGSKGDITIAPVGAPGAIVYWTNTNGTALKGFSMGEEKVHDVLKPAQASTACVGCHTSTPDGSFVAFAASADAGNGNPAQIGFRSSDGKLTTPSYISASASTLLGRINQEFPVFSKSHWTPGDRIMLSMMYNSTSKQYDILWTDLEATSTTQGMGWGILDRTGETTKWPAAAAFSHDGKSVVYAAASSVDGGHQITDGDLHVIPYAAKKGGTPVAVNGASEANYNEFYPTYSPDDQWIAYTRSPNGGLSYKNPNAEVLIVQATGATGTMPTRLAANDPPACAQKTSPGLSNSWPKWAPDATTVGNRTFYWITFSSKRIDGATPQLYVTPVVVEGGAVKTYPALYLWNQPPTEGNHTPAWDNFQIVIP